PSLGQPPPRRLGREMKPGVGGDLLAVRAQVEELPVCGIPVVREPNVLAHASTLRCIVMSLEPGRIVLLSVEGEDDVRQLARARVRARQTGGEDRIGKPRRLANEEPVLAERPLRDKGPVFGGVKLALAGGVLKQRGDSRLARERIAIQLLGRLAALSV